MRIWDRFLLVGPYLEIINKILQILALLVGGWWAYWTWKQVSAPGLDTGVKLSVESHAEWSAVDGACVGSISATIENLGVKSIDVDRVELELSTAEPVTLAADEKFKIINDFPKKISQVYFGNLNKLLALTYPPKGMANENVEFLFRPIKNLGLRYRVEAFNAENNSIADYYGGFESCDAK